jgi:hypothetical protein
MDRPFRHIEKNQPLWRRVVVLVAICAMVVTLATRTFHVTAADHPIAKSSNGNPIRQNVDSDAFEWSPPIAQFTLYILPVAAPHAPPDRLLVLTIDLDDCLSNRPPPSLS